MIGRPLVTLALALLLAAAAAMAVARLRIDTSLASLFDAHDPAAKLSTRYDMVPLLRWTEEKLKTAFPKSLFDRRFLPPCDDRLGRHCGGRCKE